MNCVCRGLASRVNQLQPTVLVDTIPELAAERRPRRDTKRLEAEPAEVVWVLL